jgi:hypothetical protein
MIQRSFVQRIAKWLAIGAFQGFGLAMAQTEPTMNQVYEAAKAGRLEQAQAMVQQVLVGHPKSAKAHFVQAELAARQGQLPRAREALATAEKLAPGLPFAQPAAVQALRSQLEARSAVPQVRQSTLSPAAPVAPPPAPFPWGMTLALGGAAIALVLFLTRKKNAPAAMPQGAYAASGGLSGPQSFGMGGAAMAPAYGQPGYGQPGYGQAPGTSLGGRVMGGLATGLAVGAGVMAAQAIGKSLMGGNEASPAQHGSDAGNAGGAGYEPFAGNSDMGGQNFGVNDASSWDDGGGASAGSDDGGGWDS